MANCKIVHFGTFVVACCWSCSTMAACAVNDGAFATADGGCKDLISGLVWSSDLKGFAGPSSSSGSQQDCDTLGSRVEGGGFTDWRTPTVGEVQRAVVNGLSSHLDFYYDDGVQSVDGEYRWTRCPAPKVRGASSLYAIRYADGDYRSGIFEVHQVICVRGVAPDDRNDCPGAAGGNKKHKATISQTATGAFLLLPLCLVIAAQCARVRTP